MALNSPLLIKEIANLTEPKFKLQPSSFSPNCIGFESENSISFCDLKVISSNLLNSLFF